MFALPRAFSALSVAAVLAFAAPATFGFAAPAAALDYDNTSRVAIVSAFQPEITVLRAAMEDAQDHTFHGVTFTTGTMAGKQVVLYLSGVSMVNAAMTTQMAADHYNLRAIVFSGIAGGSDPSRHIGDVVVPAQWGPYLEMTLARETDGKFAPPPFRESQFANHGMIFTNATEVVPEQGGDPVDQFWFKTDPKLLELAEKIAPSVKLADCAEGNDCLSHPPQMIVGGNGVSGSAFLDNAGVREWVFSTFGASAVDMESAAVAQVAQINRVPFIAFRSLSDLAGGGDGANEMGTFLGLAAENSATVVKAFVAEMN